ncbi:hypothetical protein B0A55_10539 [Friedmanniomyces simplex]|uniref:Phosphatidylethanolamine-binding protein n=1 Tax=Friedmanniomyces simplex TaxID=329884 RepID=A0A4V5NGW9_9PEZI|nr:hypothetical protein B0A55_10539 [Friedmanniomyces simplex]
MRTRHPFATLALGALVQSQTPPRTFPAAEQSLQITWNGQNLAANQTLPQSLVMTPPIVSVNYSMAGAETYMLVLADSSIPGSWLPNTTSPMDIAVGMTPDRTTWLQWLQTDLTQAANGTLYSSVAPVAPYGYVRFLYSSVLDSNVTAAAAAAAADYALPTRYPNPPSGDGLHTYVFYLFPQTCGNGSLIGLNAGRDIYSTSAPDRLDFNLDDLAATAGFPIAANYFQVTADGTSMSGNAASAAKPTAAGTASSSTQSTNGVGMPVPGIGLLALMGLASAVFMLV